MMPFAEIAGVNLDDSEEDEEEDIYEEEEELVPATRVRSGRRQRSLVVQEP